MSAVPIIFDRNKVRLHRDRAASSFKDYDFLFRHYSNDLLERLEFFNIDSKFDVILELGARNGFLSKSLQELYATSMIISSDLSEEMIDYNYSDIKIVLDDEKLPFDDESIDLIISNLSMHWVNDVPGALSQIYNILKPGGVFLCNFFGGRSLDTLRKLFIETELKAGHKVAAHISPMIQAFSVPDLMKRAGFSSQITDTDISRIKYSSIFEVMRDLKSMGESNALKSMENYSLHKDVLRLLSDSVLDNIEIEFEIITISAKKL